ncbi:lysophospholipid acyltransferase family protein [Fibrobacterota bacterium]
MYKLRIAAKILIYLFIKMIWFSLIKIFRGKRYQRSWLNYNAVHWGTLCANEVNLNIETFNYEVFDAVDWNRNVFIVANHQSYIDIPAIYVSSRKIYGFLAKQELSWIPFLHFWMKTLDCVFIKRSRYISAIKRLKKLENLGEACKLAIFPEGTRSKNGKIGPFKSGALKIAWQLNAVLIPTIITGTRAAWEERKSIVKEFPIRVDFENAIDLKEIKEEISFKEFFKAFESHFKDLHKAPGTQLAIDFS